MAFVAIGADSGANQPKTAFERANVASVEAHQPLADAFDLVTGQYQARLAGFEDFVLKFCLAVLDHGLSIAKRPQIAKRERLAWRFYECMSCDTIVLYALALSCYFIPTTLVCEHF